MAPSTFHFAVFSLLCALLPLTIATFYDDLTNVHTLLASLTQAEQTERDYTLASIARTPGQELENDHPRYRLLWSMYGFDRHFDRAVADVSTARTRYEELSDHHKDVRT
jgi:hypothetical protein